MSHYLKLDMRNAVKVGGTTLPGILTGLSVNGSLEIIQDQLESGSTHITSIKGYTTASVTLDITLHGTDDEREKQLRIINQVFSVNPPEGQVKGAASKAWRLVNPHLDARRIRVMLFTGFESREGNDEDITTVSLTFKELISEMARLEKAAEQQAGTNPQTGTVELPGINGQPKAGEGTDPTKPPAPLSPYNNGLKSGLNVTQTPAQNPPKIVPGKVQATP